MSKETTLTSIADLQLGSQLAADYQVLIKSTSVMEDVIDALDLEMTPEALRASITINNPVDTRILEVSVVNTDGELAKRSQIRLLRFLPNTLEIKWKLFRLRSSKRKDSHSADLSKHDQNILIGFLAGIVLCGGIICVLTVMDDTIKSEDDVEKYLGVPVLASVPDRKDYINKNRRKSNTLSERRYRNNEKSFNAGCP